MLYDSGSRLAGRRRSRRGAAVVPGTLVDLDPDRVDEALAVLDDVEATATDLFARIAVTTTTARRHGRTTARRRSRAWRRIARWDVDRRAVTGAGHAER